MVESRVIGVGPSSGLVGEGWQLRSRWCFHADVLKNGRVSGDLDDQMGEQ